MSTLFEGFFPVGKYVKKRLTITKRNAWTLQEKRRKVKQGPLSIGSCHAKSPYTPSKISENEKTILICIDINLIIKGINNTYNGGNSVSLVLIIVTNTKDTSFVEELSLNSIFLCFPPILTGTLDLQKVKTYQDFIYT